MEKDFILSVLYRYRDGILSKEDAIQNLMCSSAQMSRMEAEDFIDGEIVTSARHFNAIFSMAVIEDWKHIPTRFTNTLFGGDNWFGDFKVPERKMVFQINVGDDAFFFCFGRTRSAKHSLAEPLQQDSWLYKALILHSDGKWYISKCFNDSDFNAVRNFVYSIRIDTKFQDILSSLGLVEDPLANRLLAAFD